MVVSPYIHSKYIHDRTMQCNVTIVKADERDTSDLNLPRLSKRIKNAFIHT